MKYIEEFENKEEQLAITRFFEKFNEKLYETYKELSSSDKHMERRINDKMMGGGSKDQIDMLDELVDSKLLTIKT
jgi:Fe-S cluster assembly ATPase SufC